MPPGGRQATQWCPLPTGAGSRRPCRLRESGEPLDSQVLLLLHFLGEAPELEGLEEAAQDGRAEIRAREAQLFQIQDKQESWLSPHGALAGESGW